MAVNGYTFILSNRVLPVTPSSYNIRMKSDNKVITLLDGSEYTVVKKPCLRVIENLKFEVPYGWDNTKEGEYYYTKPETSGGKFSVYTPGEWYEFLCSVMKQRAKVNFAIYRWKYGDFYEKSVDAAKRWQSQYNFKQYADNPDNYNSGVNKNENYIVTVESVSMTENADNGRCAEFTVTLREHINIKTGTAVYQKNGSVKVLKAKIIPKKKKKKYIKATKSWYTSTANCFSNINGIDELMQVKGYKDMIKKLIKANTKLRTVRGVKGRYYYDKKNKKNTNIYVCKKAISINNKIPKKLRGRSLYNPFT